ncbi:immunoglobulin A1 protease autotransporter-like [Rhagoletis pomonella]|uniref:immunoglobulin A1 protease autotransporter-like n=1 Tax=Rhagoletis pomonella TaxID=28610 RepID=UPI001781844C|nr:immunoglobulin A1 protease autotransporter-like [Rhagoletis pomonella]
MGVRIFNSCVVLLVVLYVFCGDSDAAAISSNPRSVGSLTPATKNVYAPHLRIARQAYSDEDGSEEDAEVQAEQLAQQQLQQQQASDSHSQEESEEDGEDDDDNDRRRRRRRETPAAGAEKLEQSALPIKEAESAAVPEPVPVPAPATSEQIDEYKETTQSNETNAPVVNTATATTVTTSAPPRNTSVLILIRDALKKVTTLPTEQVATNALQYFQLFEHFIQKTIEEVIGDDDDDDDEAANAAAGATATTIKPDAIFTPEEEELIAGVEEILKEPELVTKQPQVVTPAGTQMEVVNQAPLETDDIVGSTKPAPGGPTLETVQEEKPAIVAEPAKVEEPVTNSV